MQPRFPLLLFLFATFCAAATPPSPEHEVWLAKRRVGTDTWSRAVELTLAGPTDVFPRRVAALAFEFQNLLWIYTPYDGTRSLSRAIGHVERDKTDLPRLLKAAIPDLVGIRDLNASWSPFPFTADEGLAFGCFIDSISALRREIASGRHVLKASLLSIYYFGDGMAGAHTVLFIETDTTRFVIDTTRGAKRIPVGEDGPRNACALADRVIPWGHVVSVRWIPVIDHGVRVTLSARAMALAMEPQT